MAFGQQTGPPASAKQVDELALLFEQAGFASFREARHIFGLTQRQAAGKFTRGEAIELIERLQPGSDGGSDSSDAPPVEPAPVARRQADRQADRQAELLAKVPADDLADELVRRGWICMPPA